MDQLIKRTYKNVEEILEVAKSLEKKTFADLNIERNSNKGIAGNIIEGFFGLEIDNKRTPDFLKAGVDLELKTTPIKKNKDGSFSQKERLILGMINFDEESKKRNFEESEVFKKIQKTLIVSYVEGINPYFIGSQLLEITSEEMLIIKNDYLTITEKIRDGKAHELSDSDTIFLGATTKGANSLQTTSQPFSNIPAKTRAFTLKTNFMKRKVDKLYNNIIVPAISKEELQNKINDGFKKYVGHSSKDLYFEFTRKTSNAKHLNRMVTDIILKKLKIDTRLFEHLGIKFKAMKLKGDKTQESISFGKIDWDELKTLDFEDTDVYGYLTNGIMLVLWDEGNKFKEIKMINFSDEKISNAEKTFNEVKESLNTKVYLPKLKDNKVLHIRPKDLGHKKSIFLNGHLKPMSELCWWINKTEI